MADVEAEAVLFDDNAVHERRVQPAQLNLAVAGRGRRLILFNSRHNGDRAVRRGVLGGCRVVDALFVKNGDSFVRGNGSV